MVKRVKKEGVDNYIYTKLSALYGESWINNSHKIYDTINKFRNNRTETTSTLNYAKKLLYSKVDEKNFFDAAGMDIGEVKNVIGDCKNLLANSNIDKDPLAHSAFWMSVYYRNHKKELMKHLSRYIPAGKKIIPPDEFVLFYLGFRIYSWCQMRVFEHEYPEAVVEATLESLSERYDFKKYHNIQEFIDDYVITNNKSLNVDMDNPHDMNMNDWTLKLKTRMKSVLSNLHDVTKEVYKKGKRIIMERLEAENPETGRKFIGAPTTSSSNTIVILCNKVLTSFIQESVPRGNILDKACSAARASKGKIKIILKNMRESKDDKVLLETIIRDILSYWIISLNKERSSIHSKPFIDKCVTAYSMSNTNDVYIIELKEVLKTLIERYSGEYLESGSKSTLNSFKQAIYVYMVYYIMVVS